MASCRVSFPLSRFQTQSVRYISNNFTFDTPKSQNTTMNFCANPESPNRTTISLQKYKVNPIHYALWKIICGIQNIRLWMGQGLMTYSKSTDIDCIPRNRQFSKRSSRLQRRLSHVSDLMKLCQYPGKPPARWNQTTFSYIQVTLSFLASLKPETDALSFQSCRTSNSSDLTKHLGWSDIFCYLKIHNRIIRLSLKKCSIDHHLAKDICERFPDLIELDLSVNTIGDEGAESIALHLKKLRVLRLVDNGVGDKSGVLIGRNLKSLRELGLNNNFIGDSTAYQVAQNLHHLRQLYLGSNQLQDNGCIQLISNLSKLVRLWLRSNRLGKMGEQQIRALASASTDLIL